MKKSGQCYGQQGSIATIAAIIILAIAFIASAGFATWAYNGLQTYKNDSDQKSAAAVQAALAVQKQQLQNQFDQLAKQPVQTFKSPAVAGGISFNYPRTWDGFVDETDSNNPVKGFFALGIVPPQNAGVNYALRVDLVSDDYTSVINSFDSPIKNGTVTATAYLPPKMAGVANAQTGMRFDGMIEDKIQGSMVVAKIRDKTLKIYTESPAYLNDFNSTVLASLTYAP